MFQPLHHHAKELVLGFASNIVATDYSSVINRNNLLRHAGLNASIEEFTVENAIAKLGPLVNFGHHTNVQTERIFP